ncbi:hypothetical protein [Streptomyces sp. NPDC048361]|uniref:hypothetical protein n=1 Tax=Streptomyces sp. NPDC048361 TaxID=3154720 RepID=UPI00343D2540
MWSRHVTTVLTALAVGTACALMAPGTAEAAATCTPTKLPLPAGMTEGVIGAADSGSGFAGWVYNASTYHAVRWSGGKVIDYGDLPGLTATMTVAGVNRSGTLVGYTDDRDNNKAHAFRSRDGKLEALPLPSGIESAFPTAINDAGDIVGWGYGAAGPGIAVLWPASVPGTAVKVAGGLPTAGSNRAVGIDQDGTVLVNSYPVGNGTDSNAVYLWRAGSARKLAVPPGSTRVAGDAISQGRVAGSAAQADGRGAGVLWDKDGSFVRPEKSALLNSVNSTGQSVGFETGGGFEDPLVTGVWQFGKEIASLTGSQIRVAVSANDGTLGGSVRDYDVYRTFPTTWRCG